MTTENIDKSTTPQFYKFETHPDQYKHFQLKIEGPIARIYLNVNEDEVAQYADYKLKLNSYDIGVDIELADAVERLRFEHPEVSVVCLESGRDDIFCAGANIYMLRQSSHSHKVNFCKFTNETRLFIEEATEKSNQHYVASVNGGCAGGGYELALACKEIHFIDDHRSSVSLPEAPLLAVLPGTGGLTRLVDKRKVRRDLADIFCTVAEGVRGKRAKDWKLVDEIYPPSVYREKLEGRLKELAGDGNDAKGIEWKALSWEQEGDVFTFEYITLDIDTDERKATIKIKGPQGDDSQIPEDPTELGCDWYAVKMWRELRKAILYLRFNYEDIGVVIFDSEGDIQSILDLDKALYERRSHWFIREILLLQGRVLKMIDVTAKTFFTYITPGTCFAGSLYEVALASDRIYMLDDIDETSYIALSVLNGGEFPMWHELSRLENRFYQDDEAVQAVLSKQGEKLDPQQVLELGLATEVLDDIDWEDEIRIVVEERLSLSPDALTGMEANLRFVGPENMATRIFARLSAWQNWIFTRPNATGEKGALSVYGSEFTPDFKWSRT